MLKNNNKYITTFCLTAFAFFAFTLPVMAVNYNSGLYNEGLYSATIPSATATPTSGTYNETQLVVLATEGSNTIRYSTTEAPADCTSGTLYTTPITISTSQTIYTLTCDTYGNSTPLSFVYTISEKNTTTGTSLFMMNQFRLQQELLNNNATPIAPLNLTRTLKLKMTGEDVKQLQIYLNNHNFKVSEIGAGSPSHETNYFGLKTKSAVIKFQIANGLVGDGIVGPLTKAKIK